MTRQITIFLLFISFWTSLGAQITTEFVHRPSVMPINFYADEKKQIEYLFSTTGDSLLWPVDNKVYISQLKNKTTIDLDSFAISPKNEKIVIGDYSAEILKKYNLKNKGTLLNPDSINFIVADFKILKHYKISKSFFSPELNLNFYHLDLAVTLKICDKVVLDNYKFKVEYESDVKRSDLKFNKAEVIDHLIKIDNKEQYYLSINIIESFFNFKTTAIYKAQTEVKRSVLMKDEIIICH